MRYASRRVNAAGRQRRKLPQTSGYLLKLALGPGRERARREREAGQFLSQSVMQFLADTALFVGDGIDQGAA